MNSYNMYTTYTVIFFHEFICESLWRCRLLSVHNILVKHCLKNWEVSQLSGVSIRRQAGLAVRCCTGRLYTAIHDDGEKMLTSIYSIYIRTVSSKPSLKIGSVSKAFLFWYWQQLEILFFLGITLFCYSR